jgi:hypothetical protein
MVNCRVPLSDATYVNKLFVPVCIHYGQLFVSIGLIAKHARHVKDQKQQLVSLLCVGEHSRSNEPAFGKDLLLVDAKSSVSIGLVSDLIPDDWANRKHANVTYVMYSALCKYMGNS